MAIDVTVSGLNTEVIVTREEIESIDPEFLLALRGEKGDKGDSGEDGADGQDGVGITSITQNQDGTLSINLDDGTSYVTEPLKGADGYTPIKGVDYFDGTNGQDGKDGADGYTPVKGVDYFDGTNGRNGVDGYTPVKGVDYFDGAKGETGATGNGIASAVLNADYTLTLTFTDGTSYTTSSIRGEKGEKGEKGDAGEVDTAMSGSSALPVQNKVIKAYVDGGLSTKADASSVPRKVSDLTNDAGYITGYTETDPTVPSWAKASSKPTYTASEVGALPSSTSIPSKVSDLTNDSGFINGNVGGMFYGTCSTAAGTVAKVVECDAFTADNLKAGTIIIVTFTATNSGAVANLTMNVNGTGAKHIKYINNGSLGNLSSAGYIKANTEYPFYYDGANWVCWFNVNTTYSALSEADMHAGTATTARLITAQRLKQAVEYHAPVTSVNGNTGAVTISVPTKTSDLTNDGDGTSDFVTGNDVTDLVGLSLLTPHFCATDATTRAVLQQAFGASAEIVVPSDITSTAPLLSKLEPRTWFAWMNGAELEFARLSVSVNTGTNAITLYLRGRTSIATGIMGVDSSWTVTPLASDAEGVAY